MGAFSGNLTIAFTKDSDDFLFPVFRIHSFEKVKEPGLKLDWQFIGQFSEVEVAFPSGEVTNESLAEAVANFHRRHEELYTFQMPWKGTELLTFYLKATVQKARFELREAEEGSSDSSSAQKSIRECIFNGVPAETPVYDGSLLRAGNRFEGPAIVEEPKTTIVVPPAFTCEVDRQHGYVLTSRSDFSNADAQAGENR